MRERRKYPRRKKVYLGKIEAGGEKTAVTVNNLSQEGMGITLNEELEIGTVIKITLLHEFAGRAYKGEKIELTLPVRVMWTKELPPRGPDFSDGVPREITEKEFDTGLKKEFLSEGIKDQYDSLLDKIKREDREKN